jgi:hypothetical protein
MEKIEEDIDVENMIRKWRQSISFINREMRHLRNQFNDDQPFSCANEPFYHKSARIDEQFDEGKQFESKSQLKIKLTEFHMEHNMEYDLQSSN